MRIIRILVLPVCTLATLAAPAARAQEAGIVTGSGLHTATFQVPQGRVVVRLPDDMAAGDVISGTVVAEPEGRGDRERRRAGDVLNGYVVEMGDARTPVSGRVLRWIVPAALAGGTATAVLRDAGGREVARAQVPVARAVPHPPNDVPRPGGWELPRIGQQGKPLEIPGPFDGSFDNTRVSVGGRPAAPLAESPRKVVFESPRDVAGPAQVELREGAGTASGPFRSVGVRLTAPRTSLLRGERTTLTVEVIGLQGLDSAVAVRLENRTPAVVGMEGGDRQDVSISPQDAASGSYQTTRTLTGVQAGSFQVAATLVPWPPLAIARP